MASGQEISDEDFKFALSSVTDWYDKGHIISMLKVLFQDHIKHKNELGKASTTCTLLDLLKTSDDLSSKNLVLLYDTIKATEQFGLEAKIRNHIPSCPNLKKITISTFSHHRQKLMKLGMKLTQADVDKIDQHYNTPQKSYPDSWSLIMDLEIKGKICEKMEAFIKTLKNLQLHQAEKALTKDFESVSPEALLHHPPHTSPIKQEVYDVLLHIAPEIDEEQDNSESDTSTEEGFVDDGIPIKSENGKAGILKGTKRPKQDIDMKLYKQKEVADPLMLINSVETKKEAKMKDLEELSRKSKQLYRFFKNAKVKMDNLEEKDVVEK